MGEISLILGGSKSGKTSMALNSCSQLPPPRLYLATAEAHDDEMRDRIERHKAERGPQWRTIEEPLDPASVLWNLEPDTSVVLLDCLTLWLSNLLGLREMDIDEVETHAMELGEAALAAHCPVIMVGNEVGFGIVPDNRLARRFRDAAGLTHQKLAAVASEVLLVTAGLAMRLK